ncbi:MAG TPA: serine/threonine-protein kinase [Polyangiaceae bacterium]|nr:serine/threonine-protein kinase [Polyangiaceae bacterium]
MGEAEESDLVGLTLCDRWRVVRLLGRGGMGSVYEAIHRNGARVAIKTLNAAPARRPTTRARLLREARAANAVDHPNAVRVLDDQVTPDGILFLVMELLEGQSLMARCDGGAPLPVSETLRIADGVLDVLAAAHRRGIVHRDVKPGNIFLTTRGEVKVLDFGVAAVRDEERDDADLTDSGAMLGTPAFMAPEQARGTHATLDARVDIWAAGATMFFCLTGRRVHEEARNAREALIYAATQRAPSVSSFRPDLDARIVHVVDRALSLDPKDRFQTAEAMRAAIAPIDGTPAEAAEDGAAPRNVPSADTLRTMSAEAPANRRREGASFSVAAVLGILGIAIPLLWARHARAPEVRRAPVRGALVSASPPVAPAPPASAWVALTPSTGEARPAPKASSIVRHSTPPPRSAREPHSTKSGDRAAPRGRERSGDATEPDVPDTVLDKRK